MKQKLVKPRGENVFHHAAQVKQPQQDSRNQSQLGNVQQEPAALSADKILFLFFNNFLEDFLCLTKKELKYRLM